MEDPDVKYLMKAATERQRTVATLQKKYAQSESVPTEQLVLDMRELLSTERVVLDAIITLFIKLGHSEPESNHVLVPAPDVVPAPDAIPAA